MTNWSQRVNKEIQGALDWYKEWGIIFQQENNAKPPSLDQLIRQKEAELRKYVCVAAIVTFVFGVIAAVTAAVAPSPARRRRLIVLAAFELASSLVRVFDFLLLVAVLVSIFVFAGLTNKLLRSRLRLKRMLSRPTPRRSLESLDSESSAHKSFTQQSKLISSCISWARAHSTDVVSHAIYCFVFEWRRC